MAKPPKTKKMALVVHSGSFDKAYPPFMLGAAGGATNIETHIFFTFWGLMLLRKGGVGKAKLPGVMRIGTGMMKGRAKKAGIASLETLLETVNQLDNVHLYACTATMDMLGLAKEDLIPEIKDYLGAAAFLDIAADCDITMFI